MGKQEIGDGTRWQVVQSEFQRIQWDGWKWNTNEWVSDQKERLINLKINSPINECFLYLVMGVSKFLEYWRITKYKSILAFNLNFDKYYIIKI